MKTQKTKKSFKKKALLSSLSMLMVATVAVGSATFAWFKQNPTANAQGLSLKATASQGLVILTESHNAKLAAKDQGKVSSFVTADYLNWVTGNATNPNPFVLSPASLDLSGTAVAGAYQTQAASNNAFTAADTALVTNAEMGMTAGKPVYKESIFCALSGAAATTDTTKLYLSGVTAKFNDVASVLKNSLRIVIGYEEWDAAQNQYKAEVIYDKLAYASTTNKMIVGVDTTTPPAFSDVKGNTNNYKNVTFTGMTATADDTDGDTMKFTGQVASNTEELEGDTVKSLGILGTTGKDKVNVYFYLDGEDENCKSTNISADKILDSVQIDLAILPQ